MSTDIVSPTGSRALIPPDTTRTTMAPFIEKNVSTMGPIPARPSGYHSGFIDEGREPGRTGTKKSARASLMMVVADGFGIRSGDVRAQVAVVKSPHNAALLHDDIAGSDDLRRDRLRERQPV